MRIDDGRLLSLLALVLAAMPLLRTPGDGRPLALALLLAAPLAVGIVFGSPVPLALSLLLAAAVLARRGGALGAGLLAGAACACGHEVVLAAPFAILPALTSPRARRSLVGLAAGYAALVAPVLALDPSGYLARLRAPSPFGPGVGLANVLFWRGLEEQASTHALFALLPVAVAVLWLVALKLSRDGGVPAEPAAGGFALVGLVVSREASPASLAIPLTLIALGALRQGGEPET
jgi:hypothetical protein